MSIPRNLLARGNNHRRKLGVTKIIDQHITILNKICDKHNIGDFTFKTCHLISADGVMTHVEFDEIKGNMRSSILIVAANKLIKLDKIYDIVQIKKNKMEREQTKLLEDQAKAKIELDRLDMLSMANAGANASIVAETIAETMTTTTAETTPALQDTSTIAETMPALRDATTTAETPAVTPAVTPATTETKLQRKLKRQQEKQEKAMDQLRSQLNKKSNPLTSRNKFCRNFFKDLQTKFMLEPHHEYRFLEVRSDSTDMVIDNAIIYKIAILNHTTEYFIVIGDLQIKSSMIKSIDAGYNMDKVFDEQSDFLRRIKEKENCQTIEVSDDDEIAVTTPAKRDACECACASTIDE